MTDIINIILLITATLISSSFCDYYCPQDAFQVPPDFNFSRSSEYDFSDGTLQIYSQIRMPCDGWVTEWRFKTLTAIIQGLNIAVFRQRMFEPVFDLVGESLIDRMATPHGMTDIWVQYRLKSPIPVRTGDCLGVFYSDVMAEPKTLSIATREDDKPLGVDQLPTYVLFVDGLTLKKTGNVDVTSAIQIIREPALVGMLTGMLPADATNTKPPSWKLAAEELPRVFPPQAHKTVTPNPRQAQHSVLSPRCYFQPRLTESFCWRPRWRYFYEVETSMCRQFYGCRSFDPEANNFDTRLECRRTCPESSEATHAERYYRRNANRHTYSHNNNDNYGNQFDPQLPTLMHNSQINDPIPQMMEHNQQQPSEQPYYYYPHHWLHPEFYYYWKK